MSCYKKVRKRAIPILLIEQFRFAKKDLRRAIFKAKGVAWSEMIKDINNNPWGRAYRSVTKQFKFPGSINPLISLPSEDLAEILKGLFPDEDANTPAPIFSNSNHAEDREVLNLDVAAAIQKTAKKNSAPGPDGIPNRLLANAYDTVPSLFKECFLKCLTEEIFPGFWKQARLVLL